MKIAFLWALAGGLALGVVGCGTTPKSATPSRAAARDDSDLFPDAEAERRIEAQARFGAGLLSELNQDANGALDQFYRSALADPSHEKLVLDVARRLLQLKDTDRATQRAFFPHPFSIGWVRDPIHEQDRWFVGADSDEVHPARVLMPERNPLPTCAP